MKRMTDRLNTLWIKKARVNGKNGMQPEHQQHHAKRCSCRSESYSNVHFSFRRQKEKKIREFQNYIMTEADQVLPTSSSIEDVPNADGSITRTTTITYDDGSKTTKQEIVPSPDGQQEVSSSTPARIEPRNCLQIVSFVLFIAAIFGIVVYFFLRAVVRASTSPC